MLALPERVAIECPTENAATSTKIGTSVNTVTKSKMRKCVMVILSSQLRWSVLFLP